MSRIDLHEVPSGQAFQSDLCIVGGGIAGLVLADALRGSGRHVDVLEAGGAKDESESQVLYAAEMAGIPHHGTIEGRFRVYGGSSTRWGGQLLPLAVHDFQRRPHVPFSGWPLDPAELSPHLRRCEDLFGVNHAPFDARLIDQLPVPGPEISEPHLQARFSKWAPFSHRNVATTLGARCEADPHTRVFLHAGVAALELDSGNNTVQALQVRTLRGSHFHFTARQVVIAAGTIETVRLLLASGLGNHSDQLGRWFHDHLSIQAATLHPQSRRVLLQRLAPWFIGRTRHTLKLETTAAWQARQGCLNVMGHLVFHAPQSSGFAWLRQQLQARQRGEESHQTMPPPSLGTLSAEGIDVAYLAWKATVRRRRWCPAAAAITLHIDSEQQPNPESRIDLSSERDALGMPKAVVDWRWSEPERHAFACYRQLFDRQWQCWNLGSIDWHHTFQAETAWQADVSDTFHLMGGTRMAASPREGVVDAQLRVHGIPNLYVASCSVFPTGGSSNPTLTLMQLTLRLADQLRISSF
jgi:choline dehydrogenase-like flavoprotein